MRALSAVLVGLALLPQFALAQTRLAAMRDNGQSYPGGRVPTYGLFEVAFSLSADYANPFAPYPADPAAPAPEQVDAVGAKAETGGVTVTGIFAGPGGVVIRVPGFWDAEGGWHVRMTPTAPGDWSYEVEVVDASGPLRSAPQTFSAVASGKPGFVRTAPGSRFLRFDNGSAFIPLGNNLAKTTDTALIRTWAARLRENGMNSQRIWLHPHYTALEWSASGPAGPSYVPDAPGLGRYCLRTARATDFTIQQAEENGIYTILCQDDTICYENSPHNEPRTGWEYNPYRTVCRNGIAFFTDELAKRYYKRRLRYMVARWGYSPHVFCWELHNEVDWPYFRVVYPDKGSLWPLADLVAWHEEMARYLRAVDPYRRPVSTNTSSNCLGWGEAARWNKYDDRFFLLHADMDLSNHHIYDENSEENTPQFVAAFFRAAPGKPLLIGEWGLSPWFDRTEQRVTLPVALHNELWLALMTAGTTPYHWFWDKYYEVGGLTHYRTVARYLEGEDPIRDGLAFVTPAVSGPAPLKAYGMGGSRRLLAWIWDARSRQFQAQPGPVSGAAVSLPGLQAGAYGVQFTDPWTGASRGTVQVQHAGGVLDVSLPAFSRDVALKAAAQ